MMFMMLEVGDILRLIIVIMMMDAMSVSVIVATLAMRRPMHGVLSRMENLHLN